MPRFEEIREIICDDPSLMSKFTSAETLPDLFSRVIDLGREHGIEIMSAELEAITTANRRACVERWLP